jgi:hypothetical protein
MLGRDKARRIGRMRVLRSWGLGVGAAIALCVSATVAVGQAPPAVSYPECTKKPTPADIEGAKGAHKAASQFYDRAEYDKAIRYWNDAYTFDCTANDLLINVANAYEKLGDRASTVATLEVYLARTGPNPTLAQKVKNLRQLMAPQPTATAAPITTLAPTASGAPSGAPTAPPVPEGPRPYGFKPWLVVGGGAALALVGAILLPVGYGAISTAEALCENHVCKPGVNQDVLDKGNSGRAQAGAGWGMLTVGLVAAGGGMVWQLLYNKPGPVAPAAPAAPGQPAPAKAGMWMVPVAGPGQAGVLVGGAF